MFLRTRRQKVAAGIRAPGTIDLISRAQTGAIRLILAETDALSGGDLPALQKKLDSYVGYALAQSSSAPTGTPASEVIIRVDLYEKPDALVLEFLRQYRVALGKRGLGFELSIHQVDVSL
jgi:hypothetical protein